MKHDEGQSHNHSLKIDKGSRLRIHVKHEMIIEVDNAHGGAEIPVLLRETPGGTAGQTNCGAYYTCSVPTGTWKTGDKMYFTFASSECPCHPKVTIPDKSSWVMVAGSCSKW